jgi:hypothetical protein
MFTPSHSDVRKFFCAVGLDSFTVHSTKRASTRTYAPRSIAPFKYFRYRGKSGQTFLLF